MPITTTVQIIGVILVPVAMITGSVLLISTLQQRYTAMGDRLRAMHRERCDLLLIPHNGNHTATTLADGVTERLSELAMQMPRIVRRHRLIRDAMTLAYVAIGVYMLDMGVLAWVELEPRSSAALPSLALFLVGTLILFVAVVIMAREAWQSHDEIAYELRHDAATPHR